VEGRGFFAMEGAKPLEAVAAGLLQRDGARDHIVDVHTMFEILKTAGLDDGHGGEADGTLVRKNKCGKIKLFPAVRVCQVAQLV